MLSTFFVTGPHFTHSFLILPGFGAWYLLLARPAKLRLFPGSRYARYARVWWSDSLLLAFDAYSYFFHAADCAELGYADLDPGRLEFGQDDFCDVLGQCFEQ